MKPVYVLSLVVLAAFVGQAAGQSPAALGLSQAVEAALESHPLARLARLGKDHLSHLKNDVNQRIAAHLQHDSRLHVCFKTGKRRLKSIRTNGKICEDVRSRLVGEDAALGSSVRLS